MLGIKEEGETLKITTKGRYAVAVMLELAYNYDKDEFLSLDNPNPVRGARLLPPGRTLPSFKTNPKPVIA